MAKPVVGKKIPAFTAQATSNLVVSSKDLEGQTYILYFYPRDNTPGCTVESQDFAANHARFRRQKVKVYGISRDNLRSHERFKAKFDLPFELIADPDEELCSKFDVMKDKNMYGKKVRGIERSTFLIDGKGVLRREWRKVRIEGHAEEVLAAVKEL